MLKLLKRSIPLTILVVFLAAPAPTDAWAQPQPDIGVTYQAYIDAVNRGDAAAAAAAFTNDGAFIVGGCPAETGCVGRAAIQARIQGSVNANYRFSIVSIIQGNAIIIAIEEHRGDPTRAAGIERVVAKVTLTFSGDKIARRVQQSDLSDPLTAAFAALSAPPAPAPAGQTAASVSPPRTGDGGLQ